MKSITGHIFSLHISDGGVPKLPVREAEITTQGVVGDRQRQRKIHGGPERAVCLFALEEIVRLQTAGHPIYPGATGENVTLAGIVWSSLEPGVCLALGDQVVVQISSYTVPCKNIRESFADGRFKRMSHQVQPGASRLYARVVQPGIVRVAQAARVVAAPGAIDPAVA